MNLRERWIQSMSKVPQSLVGYNGYTQEEADFVCHLFREHVPKKLTRQHVLELEADVELKVSNYPRIQEQYEIMPSFDNKPVSVVDMEEKAPVKLASRGRPRKDRITIPNPDDYPGPWCTVKKDGQIIRYEDAYGRPIPEVLWPVNNKN